MKLVKTYKTKNKSFDLSQLDNDLDNGDYIIKALAVSKEGNKSKESSGIEYSIQKYDDFVEDRNIWIKFMFYDKNYNPKEHQLAVGKAIIGTDKYNESSKNFSADWQIVNKAKNIWMWGIKEGDGTNLNDAFTYGGGEGVGIPLLSNDTIYSGIPKEICIQEGETLEDRKKDAQNWNPGYRIDEEDYINGCEIVEWNLSNATSINNLLGTNVYYNNTLYGKLPGITSNTISSMTYAFNRLFHITEIGDLNLSNCAIFINSMMTMISLEKLPIIRIGAGAQISYMFAGCCNASKESIESAYYNLLKYTIGKDKPLVNCGINKDSTALDNIPSNWGGKHVPIIDEKLQEYMNDAGKTVSDITDFSWLTEEQKATIKYIDLNAFSNFTSINADDFWYDPDDKQYFTALEYINFGKITTTPGQVLRQCDKLITIVGENIKEITGSSFIKGCKTLENLYLPSLTKTAEFAFASKKNISSLVSLKNLILDNLKTVGAFTFDGATDDNITPFKTISLRSATTINNGAFRYCGNLTDLYLPEKVPSLNVSGNPIFDKCYQTIKIHVKSETGVENYKYNTSWNSNIGSDVTLEYISDWI